MQDPFDDLFTAGVLDFEEKLFQALSWDQLPVSLFVAASNIATKGKRSHFEVTSFPVQPHQLDHEDEARGLVTMAYAMMQGEPPMAFEAGREQYLMGLIVTCEIFEAPAEFQELDGAANEDWRAHPAAREARATLALTRWGRLIEVKRYRGEDKANVVLDTADGIPDGGLDMSWRELALLGLMRGIGKPYPGLVSLEEIDRLAAPVNLEEMFSSAGREAKP